MTSSLNRIRKQQEKRKELEKETGRRNYLNWNKKKD